MILNIKSGVIMKNLNLFLVLSIFLPSTLFAKTLFCGVYLMDYSGNVLSQKVVKKEGVGILAGNYEGDAFYVVTKKKRFLRKPLTTSQVSFYHLLQFDGTSGEAEFTFFLQSNPNKYGILTKSEALGTKVTVRTGEEKFEFLNENFAVKSYCNITQD